jgi:hypothetical protein
MSTSVYTGLNTFNFILKHFLQIIAPLLLCKEKVAIFLGLLYALLQARHLPLAPTCAMILMDCAA